MEKDINQVLKKNVEIEKGLMFLEINKRINVTAHVRYTSHSVVAHHGYSFAIDQEFFKVPADVAVTNWGVVQFR